MTPILVATLCLCVGALLSYTHPAVLALAALGINALGYTTPYALGYTAALLAGATLMVTVTTETAH